MRIPNGNCIEIYILAEQRVEKINFVTLALMRKVQIQGLGFDNMINKNLKKSIR